MEKVNRKVFVVAQLNGMKVLGCGLQFTCVAGQEYPTMGGPKDGDASFCRRQTKVFLFVWFPFSYSYPPQDGQSVINPFLWNPDWTSFFLGCISPCYSCASLPNFSQFSEPLAPYLLVFIYKVPLLGSSWWRGYSLCWWAPLCYIFDQMGPATRDWYDPLGTCTKCQLMLDSWIPSRHYLLISI